MIVEERIHTLKPEAFAKFMKHYSEEGYPIKRKHLGDPIAHFKSETRHNCQLVQLWQFRDLDERQDRCLSLIVDKNWQAFVRKMTPFVKKTEHRILQPTAIPPLRENGED